MSDASARLVALEGRVAHQDRTLEELDATIVEQWRRIDALAREVTRLTERLAEASRREPGAPEPPPPHY